MAAGATDNGEPGEASLRSPRYAAANVFSPDGYSLEAVSKSWQHTQQAWVWMLRKRATTVMGLLLR